ncbi:MAG: Rrf2 family transcriptional regulator [Candidatus Methanomethylophilaceae archaeon]|nr:Rrf2 family transcriptional regulator [Candidatus Methanomethylophilaceae archaeon]
MFFSAKTRAAILMLVDIAVNQSSRNVKVRDIAARTGVSFKYVEQVIHSLSAAGLTSGERGPLGGYRLNMPPEDIAVIDIVRATETASAQGSENEGTCSWISKCVDMVVWTPIDEAVEDILSKVTLADILEKARAEGMIDAVTEPEYYI